MEGCYIGEDLEDVKRQWEAKKLYFLDYKKDGTRPPCIDLAMALHGFGIDNIAAQHAIEGSKASLMFVIHLSAMTMLLPLAQMPIQNGGTGMKTMLWDINFT